MPTCLGKSCSVGFLCMYFVNVFKSTVCATFPFDVGFDCINPDHCLSFYFM